MDADRLTQFMDELMEATRAGRVRWQAESNASFLLGVPSGSVRIRSVDADGRFPFEVTLFDDNGVSLESAETRITRDAQNRQRVVPVAINEALSALYDAARDSALNIDGLVQGILEDIQSGNTGTPEKTPPPPSSPDEDIPF